MDAMTVNEPLLRHDVVETSSQQAGSHRAAAPAAGGARKLLLVGNPNVGKSLLFTRLTKRYVTVSNYPGTTVEITSAEALFDGELREVIDTPGAHDLMPRSEEERVTRDLLLRDESADVVLVGDMSNIRRTLLLAIQLIEYDVPFVLCLNMADEAREHALEIDTGALATRIGVRVVATSALRRWNIERLKREAIRPAPGNIFVDYGLAIEAGIARIRDVQRGASRGMALSMLAGDDTFHPAGVAALRRDLEQQIGQPIGYAIARARYAAAEAILNGEASEPGPLRLSLRDWIGRVAMHRVAGLFVVAAVLYIAWLFVGKLGAGILVDFLQTEVFERRFNVLAIRLADFILEIPPIRTPKLSNILIKVSARTEWYLKEAVPLFVVGTLVLYLLEAAHLLGRLQSALAPLVVGGLGLPAEAANAFVVGFLRRDYGAAGLYAMQRAGNLSPNQTVIALTVITLFIPCIANFFMIVKERGARAGVAIAAFILVYSFAIGGLLRVVLDLFGVRLGK